MRQRDLNQFEALKPKDPAARGGVEISRRIPAEVALKEHNGPTNRQSGELRFAVCLDYQTFMKNPPGRAVGRTKYLGLRESHCDERGSSIPAWPFPRISDVTDRPSTLPVRLVPQ